MVRSLFLLIIILGHVHIFAQNAIAGNPGFPLSGEHNVSSAKLVTITQEVSPLGADDCTLDYVKLTTNESASFSPTLGLYTNYTIDAAGVPTATPYTGGLVSTVYASPNGTGTYTATSASGSASVVITKNKKVFKTPGTRYWSTSNDWFPPGVPDSDKCVNIPASRIVNVSNHEIAKTITIAQAGRINILTTMSLTISGAINITNNASKNNLVVNSDGNLIQQDNAAVNSGEIQFKRKVKMRKMDYTYWGSPVASQILLNTSNVNTDSSTGGFSPGTPNNRIFRYKESNDYFVATTDTHFVPAKGYAIRGKGSYSDTNLTSDELLFTGVPNNGLYSVTVERSPNQGTVEHGYNLIGNPYPSNIDFIQFYNLGNNKNVIFGKAWFWTNYSPVTNQEGSSYSGNNYAALTLSGGVPPTEASGESPSDDVLPPTQYILGSQGFMVQVRNVGLNQTLTFNNSIRSGEYGVFYNGDSKQADTKDRYWLRLKSPQGISNTILLAHIAGATNDYDDDYDTEPFTIGDDSFYSLLSSKKLQIEAKGEFNKTGVFPLGAKFSQDGIYKIELRSPEGIFENGQSIYLKDKLTGNITNLSETLSYSFEGHKGFTEDRFEIVYQLPTLGVSFSVKSDLLVYRDAENFIVRSEVGNIENIELYDMSGKLYNKIVSGSREVVVNTLGIDKGIYVLKITRNGEISTRRILK